MRTSTDRALGAAAGAAAVAGGAVVVVAVLFFGLLVLGVLFMDNGLLDDVPTAVDVGEPAQPWQYRLHDLACRGVDRPVAADLLQHAGALTNVTEKPLVVNVRIQPVLHGRAIDDEQTIQLPTLEPGATARWADAVALDVPAGGAADQVTCEAKVDLRVKRPD